MPIYEFRCMNCGHIFEILQLAKGGKDHVCCPECAFEGCERVVSRPAPVPCAAWENRASGPQLNERSCPTGSCQTITLPGHTK
jgi:putative FmdB family regulatory protein